MRPAWKEVLDLAHRTGVGRGNRRSINQCIPVQAVIGRELGKQRDSWMKLGKISQGGKGRDKKKWFI